MDGLQTEARGSRIPLKINKNVNEQYKKTGSEPDELQFYHIPIAIGKGYVAFPQIPELQEINKFTYVFNYLDHLGNVRLSYAENPKNLGNIVILEENNYYPFGLQHPGYNKETKDVDFAEYLSRQTKNYRTFTKPL